MDPVRKLVELAAAGQPITEAMIVEHLISDMAVSRLYETAQKRNLQTQLGGTTGRSPTASLVTKAASSLFGFSVDVGSPGTSSEGISTMTFSGKPVDALVQRARNTSYLTGIVDECDSRILRALSPLSLSATFLMSGQTAATPTTPLTEQALEAFTIRYEVFNTRDSRRSARAKNLVPAASVSEDTVGRGPLKVLRAAPADPTIQNWMTRIQTLASAYGARVAAGLPENARERAYEELEHAIVGLKPGSLDGLANRAEFEKLLADLVTDQGEAFLKEASRGTLLTVELGLDNNKVLASPLWNLKGIYSRAQASGNVELTGNFVVEWYGTPRPLDASIPPPTVPVPTGVYSWQLAGQVDVRVAPFAKDFGAISIAGQWQNRMDVPTAAVKIVQAKYTLPIGGVTITPIAVTWSTPGDPITGKKLSLNFGVGLNLDTLLSGIRPH